MDTASYMTGVHALNIPDRDVVTGGDWHGSTLDWSHAVFLPVGDSFFGDYGLEQGHLVPGHEGPVAVANNIRACLDALYDGNFIVPQGMADDLIANDDYDEDVFSHAVRMSDLPHWGKIDSFLEKEYGFRWMNWRKERGFGMGGKKMSKKQSLKHQSVIKSFLGELSSETDEYVLKGGQALIQCYGMPRVSEDIDFDGKRKQFMSDFVPAFCERHGYNFRVAKDTDTTQRFFIDYGGVRPLKIEISFRNKDMDMSGQTEKRNGIRVYTLDRMFRMKLMAFNGRNRIRDLQDIVFMFESYEDQLSEGSVERLNESFMYGKGLDQFDYPVSGGDEFDGVDVEKLAEDLLIVDERLDEIYGRNGKNDVVFDGAVDRKAPGKSADKTVMSVNASAAADIERNRLDSPAG